MKSLNKLSRGDVLSSEEIAKLDLINTGENFADLNIYKHSENSMRYLLQPLDGKNGSKKKFEVYHIFDTNA